ncbi:hypothetical protein [Mesorhizobium amorphae]|uniref:hypothetical protein n=1 Tax=Mesorhizobium amorphae TaxID=71433 RepID=UPI00177CF2B2|nr:hypothetical protein [Mesorhizobium amorphae]
MFVYVTEWMLAKHAAGADKAALLATWHDALDYAMLQKVLPKIHGNRRALGDPPFTPVTIQAPRQAPATRWASVRRLKYRQRAS